ncbi:hypothetical protein SAMN05216345_10376 [Cupriavidus sp. YR651]|uniref:hypothetical protein n=1 Tax=Cupriavidus sp. YR651 TaxID=1855315 RepID=UPI000891C4E6|nr:hypothetical protein [Cupriavidus sp. YR651]SDC63111.1 hypothetical protein SAMN05216345_10376 [Cupriavidus sp. YR651]
MTHDQPDAPTWRFDHLNVSAGGRQVLDGFFGDIMGLRPGYRPPFPFPGAWLYAGDQAVIHAVDDARLDAQAGDLQVGHIAFRSDGPAAPVIEQLRNSPYPFRVARVPADSTLQIFVMLPGGLVIELDMPDDGAAGDYQYGTGQTAPAQRDFKPR